MTIALALVLAASVGPIAFEASGGFLLVSRRGEVLERIQRPGGMEAETLTVSPDGKVVVFTARKNGGQPLLYKLEDRSGQPVLLSTEVGYHAHPTFSNDGTWVFFIRNASKDGGPPGEHAPREYGQLWKVNINGSNLQQLTQSTGCKLYPDTRDGKTIVYTHTDCGNVSGIEALTSTSTRFVSPMNPIRPHLPRLSGDGKTVALARIDAGKVHLELCRNGKCEQLASFPRDSEPRQLAWTENDEGLLLSLGPSIWHVRRTNGSATAIIDLFKEYP